DDTYLYVDEKNVWCTRETIGSGAAVASGNGSVKAGENTLVVAGATWEKDQWKGYALWINPSGGSAEKHIISQNYSTHLMVEGHDPFNTDDAACPYEIHKLVLRKTTELSHSGTANTGSPTTLRDITLNESNDFWNGYEMKITSGNNIGLTRTITDYIVGSFDLVFDALPYAIVPGDHHELYLNPETQILIVTGIPSVDANETAGINANVTAAVPNFQVIGSTRAYDALNTSNILITDLINDRLDTSARYIKGEFTFTASGAIKISTDADNGLWLSPTGILAKHLGVNTFTIDNLGNATFAGDLSAASGTFGGTVLGTATFVGTGASSIEGKANDAFQKSSDDSADIIQDANNKFVTSNEKTGAGRAYTGFTSNYYITRGIVNTDLSARALPYAGIRVDQSGIYGRKGGSTTFYINSSGDAYFKGTLGASSMEAGNWLRFYDSSGYDCGSIYASSYDLLFTGTQSISDIIIRGGSSATVSFAVGASVKSFVNSTYALVAGADISMLSHKIQHLATPISSTDAATKGYVDGAIGGGCANVWRYISTDAGTTIASGCNDTLFIRGTGIVSTSRVGDTIYINAAGSAFSCSDLGSCYPYNFANGSYQCYGGYCGSRLTSMADFIPSGNNIFELGSSVNKWYRIYRQYESGCDLPTSNSGIEVMKKVKSPKVLAGDYGKRHYFQDKYFPDEMKVYATREGEEKQEGPKEIEFTKTLGVAVQAIRELIEKVEKIEEKVYNT
ncbi:hypothetical protein KKF82_04530, partial [Patescibacteria group bacterium]|nr:hypothetical protein [Patescibacteria group bacterium]